MRRSNGWALALGLASAVTGALGACGGSTSDTNTGTGATGGKGTGGAGGSGATATGGAGGTVTGGGSGGTGGAFTGGSAGSSFGGGGGLDASSDVVLQDAGWFDCGGCACDGTTQYCVQASGGALSPPPPPDAATCSDSGTPYGGCTALPATCPSPPTCDCVPLPFGGACTCSDDGGGLLVKCYLP